MSFWTIVENLDWPDTEAVTCTYLAGALSVSVTSRPPDPKPSTFVVVERAGGVASGLIDPARLVLQCWGQTKEQALDLALAARNAMFRMRGVQSGFTVYDIAEAGGPVWALDPDGDLPRYLLTVEARFRANPKGS